MQPGRAKKLSEAVCYSWMKIFNCYEEQSLPSRASEKVHSVAIPRIWPQRERIYDNAHCRGAGGTIWSSPATDKGGGKRRALGPNGLAPSLEPPHVAGR